MKIQSLKLFNEKYRGLEKFEKLFPKHILLKNHIDPICLVGLNGSGKSNFLELVADIFYDLEIFFLHESKKKLYKVDSPKYFAYADKNQDPIYFELRYKINVRNKSTKIYETAEIQISRNIPEGRSKRKSDPEFKIKVGEEYKRISIDVARDYLPLVVGYTSGLNDLLSMPFIDLQDFYAQQVAKIARNKKSEINGEKEQDVDSPNLLLLSYDSNAAIVVSNLMLAEKDKTSTIKEILRIDRLNSFRIVIRWNKLYTRKRLNVTNELQNYINDLSDCAILKETKKESANDEVYTMDFICDDNTKDLFKEKFGTPQKLFEALTKLNLLNTLCIQKTQREKLRKKREKGHLIKFPQIATLDKIFSIEKIELVLQLTTKNLVKTEYEKISDGEHQFIHIIGGILLFDEAQPKRDILYLLDEPDTHFNPLWRSDFFYQLEEILENKDVEFILTTHSPFILSDCHGYNVFKFTRENEKVAFDRIKNETYGSTFDNILENLFHSDKEKDRHFNNQMAKLSFTRIEQIHSKIQNAITQKELEKILKEIKLLGESIDRLEILKHYTDKQTEILNQK